MKSDKGSAVKSLEETWEWKNKVQEDYEAFSTQETVWKMYEDTRQMIEDMGLPEASNPVGVVH